MFKRARQRLQKRSGKAADDNADGQSGDDAGDGELVLKAPCAVGMVNFIPKAHGGVSEMRKQHKDDGEYDENNSLHT